MIGSSILFTVTCIGFGPNLWGGGGGGEGRLSIFLNRDVQTNGPKK